MIRRVYLASTASATTSLVTGILALFVPVVVCASAVFADVTRAGLNRTAHVAQTTVRVYLRTG